MKNKEPLNVSEYFYTVFGGKEDCAYSIDEMFGFTSKYRDYINSFRHGKEKI